MRPHRASLAAAATLLAAVAAPAAAHAAACCMSATAFGAGRLLIWEDFAVGLRTSVSPALGDWDQAGRWRPYRDYADLEWRTELWGMAALSRRASAFARVPWLVNRRASQGATPIDDLGTGLADVSAGLRYELLAVGEYVELPAVALTATVTAPTGRATHDATTPLGVDVTGRGAWVASAGLSLERTHLPWYARLDLGVSIPLPAHRPDVDATQRYGVELSAVAAGGAELSRDLVLSLVTRASWQAPLTLAGRSIEGSDRADLGLGLAASWRLTPNWTAQAALDTGLFLDGLGDNHPGRITTTLGLRYGHF